MRAKPVGRLTMFGGAQSCQSNLSVVRMEDCQETRKTRMWEAIVGWFKALFGGKGTTQIGKGNQAVSGSSAGDNSPVVTAGRDVHFNMPTPAVSQEPSSALAELEETIPDVLSKLRKDLADHPLTRDIIVLDKK